MLNTNDELEKNASIKGDFFTQSIKKKLLKSFMPLAIIPVVLCVLCLFKTTHELNSKNQRNTIEQLAKEKVSSMNLTLDGLEKDLDKILQQSEQDKPIDSILQTVKSSDANILYAYIAKEGDAYKTYPAVNLPKDFDPVKRPWYEVAKKNRGNLVILNPYIDSASGKNVITLSKSSKSISGKEMVASIDVVVDTFYNNTNETKIGEKGYSMIITKEGIIVTHPNKDICLKNIADLNVDIAKKVLSEKEGSVIGDIDGEKCIIGYTSSKRFGWILVSVINEGEYNAGFTSVLNYTIVLVSIVIALCIIVCLFVAGNIERPIKKLAKQIEGVSEGDLNIVVEVDRQDEIGIIQNAFKSLIEAQRSVVLGISNICTKLNDNSVKIYTTSKDNFNASNNIIASFDAVSNSVKNNLVSIEEVDNSIEELASTSQVVSNSSVKISDESENTLNVVNRGKDKIKKVHDSIEDIKNSAKDIDVTVAELYDLSQEINVILKAITDISVQTNLLALNAAIEAARAGEVGKGFAVVADEVRKLADESSNAVTNAESIIKNIQNKISSTVDITKKEIEIVKGGEDSIIEAKKSFESIIEIVDNLNRDIEDVASSSEEQTASIEEVASIMNNINTSVESSSHSLDEIMKNATSQKDLVVTLEDCAKDLDFEVKNFEQILKKYKL